MLKEKIEKIYESNRGLDYATINKEYIYSVSKIVEQFKEPFDAEAQAERCSQKYKDDPKSKYYGMEPWDIIEMWNNKREHAIKVGKSLDSFIGAILESQNEKADKLYNDENDETIISRFNTFRHVYDNEFKKNNFEYLCRELTLFDPINKWKGRFDALFGKDNSIILIDWKSNDEISIENSFNNLKGPLYRYDASDLNSYTIQLYLYKYALEKFYGFENVKTLLCRIGMNDYQFLVPKIPYSEELVENIIKYAIGKINTKK